MRMLIGLRNGLSGFCVEAADAPVSLFPGIQPLLVAVGPSSPERLYCATYDRGLWRSAEAGETWCPAGTPQDYFGPPSPGTIPERQTTFVSVSPSAEANGCHAVWVGTESSRLYRSTDQGETFGCVSPLDLPSRARWSFPPCPDTHHVQRIAHGSDGRVHVAIEAGAMLVGRDGGRSFDDRRQGSPIDTHVLLTHPLAPRRLYAALGDALFTPGHSFAESRDDGDTWSYVGAGLEAMPYLYGLALNPADPDDMLVAASPNPRAAHAGGGASIFRRAGERWVEDAAGFPTGDSLLPVLAADPGDPGGWFALSDYGLFARPSGATTWTVLTAPADWRGVHPTTLTVLDDRR